MWTIKKEFHFEYGHRVWNQVLDGKYSIDDKCVCRHLHGHSGVVTVYLEGKELKDGFITDFKHLNFFKEFLDNDIDHKFIIDSNDPLIKQIFPALIANWVRNDFDQNFLMYKKINIDIGWTTEIKEYFESFVIVDFVPTSENLCKWFYDIIEVSMKQLNVKVNKIEFNETKKTGASYAK